MVLPHDPAHPPIIAERALRSAITPARAVEVIREAFRADGEGRTRVPSVINLEIPTAHGEFHIKTAYIEGVPHVAIKVASGFYDNPAKGLPSGSGLMVLCDAATGFPVALLLDNGYLTDVRTGAAGAVAADVLARKSIEVAGVIGSGIQARHQIRCLAAVRRFGTVLAWSPTRAHLETYLEEMRDDGFDARPAAGAEAVCREADIVITATPSRRPLIESAWLREGLHVTAVGSDAPGKQELTADCLHRADIVAVDRLSQCGAFGELKHAIDRGMLSREAVPELGAIVAGRKRGRLDDRQITIADLTGVGFQDTAIASEAFAAIVHT
jgi:ornithine cyclodeaminase